MYAFLPCCILERRKPGTRNLMSWGGGSKAKEEKYSQYSWQINCWQHQLRMERFNGNETHVSHPSLLPIPQGSTKPDLRRTGREGEIMVGDEPKRQHIGSGGSGERDRPKGYSPDANIKGGGTQDILSSDQQYLKD